MAYYLSHATQDKEMKSFFVDYLEKIPLKILGKQETREIFFKKFEFSPSLPVFPSLTTLLPPIE